MITSLCTKTLSRQCLHPSVTVNWVELPDLVVIEADGRGEDNLRP